MYWKLNEKEDYIEYDYPRDMSIWRNVPVPLDSAFQNWDGKILYNNKTGNSSVTSATRSLSRSCQVLLCNKDTVNLGYRGLTTNTQIS